VLNATVDLAKEIARDGPEGRPIGALFTIGHARDVLRWSRGLILNPLEGHAPEATQITDPQFRGTVKELAQLDGAFVITDEGTVIAACRYLNAPATGVNIPLGLGTRHLAGASVSKHLGVVAIVVSQTGFVRVFCDGEMMSEIASAR
jgi:diadenylate cyclase